ncbi:MAG: RNA-binding S4 domain-containing protein [Alphaproteobacteria bacterium]|nr:RNA-binding S4 domain-containing protein [Alphaproteobacteria bacterium]
MQRIDKFLWFARFFKSRTMASSAVNAGKVRINGQRCDKASTNVKPSDVLTFSAGARVRVIKVLNGGTRRGPASEAQSLYEDLTPPLEQAGANTAQLTIPGQGVGRPTKRDRRAISALKGRDRDG